MLNDQEGVYSKTQAFNFLKELLSVSKKVLIKKDFFVLFFNDTDGSMYILKKSEDIIRNIFTEKGIAELNRLFYQYKQEHNSAEMSKTYSKVLNLSE